MRKITQRYMHIDNKCGKRGWWEKDKSRHPFFQRQIWNKCKIYTYHLFSRCSDKKVHFFIFRCFIYIRKYAKYLSKLCILNIYGSLILKQPAISNTSNRNICIRYCLLLVRQRSYYLYMLRKLYKIKGLYWIPGNSMKY